MPILTPSRAARTPARAEAVGSLLRASAITSHLDRIYADRTTSLRSLVLRDDPQEIAELNRLADGAIVELVRRQIDAGLDVVTDGEQRRLIFLSSFYDAAEGLAAAEERLQMPGDLTMLNEPVVVERLRKSSSPAAEEASFLRSVADFPFKITLPAPSYFFSDFIRIDSSPYASKVELLQDVVAVTKGIVVDAIAAGARWIQFDFPIYPALAATDTSSLGSLIEDAGGSREWLLDQALKVDSAVTEEIPDGVTVGLHLCRGNFEGGFWSGSLAPIAERMFNELPHQRFLFEWEDIAREGDYEPIRHVPKDRIMAMGMISTKTSDVETDDEILRRIEAASKHLDIGQLALCTQCGFASVYGDHLASAEEVQWRKLELIGRVADQVWGRN
jgi:5-methyltetrahydropteroyltriglutamate--homocysteine methyltransferase